MDEKMSQGRRFNATDSTEIRKAARPNVVIIMADDPAFASMIATYSARLKGWMQQQNDEGASIDRVYQTSK
jgi:hypothetical protein